LLLPVHVDPFRVGHAFAALGQDEREVKAFFSVAGERSHETFLKLAADKPVVRNDAAERADLLASWGNSFGNRPGTETAHSLSAYLQFKKPGEFNLAGRLA